MQNTKHGGKATNLGVLQSLGLPVPQFVVIPMGATISEIEQAIDHIFEAKRYAVRSSALLEDTSTSAMAGQFKTVLDVKKVQLLSAVQEVQAGESDCAVIIQEFIEADLSGVLFTRNPKGSHEAVIEYVKGRGDALVSGTKSPQRLKHYWNQSFPSKPDWLPDLLAFAATIENHYNLPQDIEWCVLNRHLYIVQTRPITTLTPDSLEQMRMIDQCTPSLPFTYEKTEICEIAPRPSVRSLEMLSSIYAKGGPVDNVYTRYGVHYQDTTFLKVIGGQLYVDTDAEKASLDVRRIEKIAIPKPEILNKKLLETFNATEFFEAYETIFEINLLAGIACAKLAAAGKMLKKNSNELLEIPSLLQLEEVPETYLQGLIGNSLNLSDDTAFQKVSISPKQVPTWFAELPAWKQTFIQPHVDLAQQYLSLRERGRWLTVFLLNKLHMQEAPIKGETPELPAKISNREEPQTKVLGVSPGIAKGTVVTREQLPDQKDKVILVTALLTPDLVAEFPRLLGIIATNGGLLSHLAIMAREAGIPVVTGYANVSGLVGKLVSVDGTTGIVT